MCPSGTEFQQRSRLKRMLPLGSAPTTNIGISHLRTDQQSPLRSPSERFRVNANCYIPDAEGKMPKANTVPNPLHENMLMEAAYLRPVIIFLDYELMDKGIWGAQVRARVPIAKARCQKPIVRCRKPVSDGRPSLKIHIELQKRRSAMISVPCATDVRSWIETADDPKALSVYSFNSHIDIYISAAIQRTSKVSSNFERFHQTTPRSQASGGGLLLGGRISILE